jgi:hypothetical protein
VRTFDGSVWARSAGRLVGDASVAPLFAIGLGVSLLPEQVENLRTGAPWNEFVADGMVDSGIFLGSEAAGLLGLLGGTRIGGPWVGVPLKFVVDIVVGGYLEWKSDQDNRRGGCLQASLKRRRG